MFCSFTTLESAVKTRWPSWLREFQIETAQIRNQNQVQSATRRFFTILEGTANIASLQALNALPAHGVDYKDPEGGND